MENQLRELKESWRRILRRSFSLNPQAPLLFLHHNHTRKRAFHANWRFFIRLMRARKRFGLTTRLLCTLDISSAEIVAGHN